MEPTAITLKRFIALVNTLNASNPIYLTAAIKAELLACNNHLEDLRKAAAATPTAPAESP